MTVIYHLTFICYDLDFVLSKRHTLVLSNTRELNRVPNTTFYLIYKLTMVCATLLQPYPKQPYICLKVDIY